MKTTDQRPSGSSVPLAEALKSVQAGLKAIESMQARTTEAHQKFLDVQQEASRTLQQMMTSAERLSQALAGNLPAGEPFTIPPVAVPPQVATPAPKPETTPAVEPSPPAPSPPPPVVAETAKSTGSAVDNVLATLVAVVSELTGYPESMLNADMDLEADLGIDSIKRVEILSALEERLPGRGSISAEQMTELKTLGDIAAALGGLPTEVSGAIRDTASLPSPPAPATPSTGERLSSRQLDALAPRRFVKAVPCAPPEKVVSLNLAPEGRLLVAGGDADLGPLLARDLKEAGLNAIHLFDDIFREHLIRGSEPKPGPLFEHDNPVTVA